MLSGAPHSRPALVDLASNISKGISLLICGHVLLPVSISMGTFIYILTALNLRDRAAAPERCGNPILYTELYYSIALIIHGFAELSSNNYIRECLDLSSLVSY